ncbi:MAG: AMP-binding protein [Micrococcales bacterium]|nr:AMP-binding protein [Micrococcales bacterium]
MANAAAPIWGHALARADREAVCSADLRWTYGQLVERAAALAGRLRDLGVGPGDRVLLLAPSLPEFAAAYYGILGLGAIAVTVNTMSTKAEIEYYVDDAGCAAATAWHQVAGAVREVAQERGIPFVELDPALAGVETSGSLAEPVPVAADDTAAILYTSGTTGRPKGAELMHRNLAAAAAAVEGMIDATDADRTGTALPLFHVFGQAVVMNSALTTGGALVLRPRFDPVEQVALVGDERLSIMSGVPTMWNAMLHAEGDYPADHFASLRVCSSGGASLPGEVVRAFGDRFGAVILEGWGLTETTGLGSFNGLHRPRKVGMVGLPVADCRIEIRDLDGKALPPGEVGQIWITGPVVMKGYWQRPEATDEVLVDGWFNTGDLGLLDEDGDLQISGRAKELIIRGGYNVYPAEVEDVLYRHPDILEVAVIGVPDEHYGEEIAAVVVLAPGSTLGVEELRDFAKQSLSAYKVPRLVHRVEALPKGSTGKIQKRAIDVEQVASAGGQ